MDYKVNKFSFFFPVFNEEKCIERTINLANEVGEEMLKDGEIDDYEILIVDDFSTDRTPEILNKLIKMNRHLRVIRHPYNRKLGGALKTGLNNADGDVILYSDADLPFDLVEAKKALRLMKIYNADIVSAYRHDRTSEGFRRTIYSFVYNMLIRILFRIRVRDVNFSFKLIKKRVLKSIELKSEGSFIDAELLLRASRGGFKIIQFGVDYFARTQGISSLSSFGVITKIMSEMFSQFRELRMPRKDEKVDSKR